MQKSVLTLAAKHGQKLNEQGKVKEALALFTRLADHDNGQLTYLGAKMAHEANHPETKSWLQKYIETFPEGERAQECKKLLDTIN